MYIVAFQPELRTMKYADMQISAEENMAKTALALGGGGARGMAYIGVFKVFQEEGVRPDLMVGTSIGALAACMWSYSGDWRWVRQKTIEFLENRGFRKYGAGLGLEARDAKAGFFRRLAIWTRRLTAAPRFFLSRGLFSAAGLRDAIFGALPQIRLEQLPIPVAVVVLDLVSTEEVTIREGDARDACAASANLAGFFPPVAREGRLLVDSSSIASVPVFAAHRLGAEKIIGVDIRSSVPAIRPTNIRTALDATIRLGIIAADRANQSQIDQADVVIKPEVGDVFWSDFRDLERLEKAGEEAARAALPEIRKVLAG